MSTTATGYANPTKNEAMPNKPVEVGDLALEPIGLAHVVGREDDDIGAVHELVERLVQRAREAAVLAAHEREPVLLRQRRQDRRRAVLRPVVDDDELEIAVRLAHQALDAGGDVRGVVVARDDDRNTRRHDLP